MSRNIGETWGTPFLEAAALHQKWCIRLEAAETRAVVAFKRCANKCGYLYENNKDKSAR